MGGGAGWSRGRREAARDEVWEARGFWRLGPWGEAERGMSIEERRLLIVEGGFGGA